MSETMRAVVITEPGDADVLEVREVDRPQPGQGEVLVRVASSGINRADLLQRMGRYPAPEGWPRDIPGLELAGVVEAVGAGVEDVAEGDRVMGLLGGGGYAEYALSPAATLVPVPEDMPLHLAGAVPEAFMTAFDAVFAQCRLGGGETLLIHAVGSGVGTAAVQIARTAGARIIGTSRTPEKLEKAAELGMDHGVVGGTDAWPEEVMELTDGEGVDVILDLVGGPYLEGNQKVLGMKGRHIVVGVTGGTTAQVDLRALMGVRGSIIGTVLRARPLGEKIHLARAFIKRVLPRLESEAAVPVIDDVLAPEDAADAHRRMEENRTYGKLLLGWFEEEVEEDVEEEEVVEVESGDVEEAGEEAEGEGGSGEEADEDADSGDEDAEEGSEDEGSADADEGEVKTEPDAESDGTEEEEEEPS